MLNRKNICHITITDEVMVMVDGLHKIHADQLYDRYGFFAPNHFFNPRFKLGTWDGKLRYFQRNGSSYVYMLEEIIPWLFKHKYKVEIDDRRKGPYVKAKHINENHFADRLQDGNPVILRYYQVEAINSLIAEGKGLIIAATSAGKAQPLNSKVLTPTGWKLMGDINVGDVVSTPKNGVATVVGVFPQGHKDIYQITFDDGAKVECCIDHLWECHVPKAGSVSPTAKKVVDTQFIKDWIEHPKRIGHLHIDLPKPIDFVVADLPIHPYALGALLGDGGFTRNAITFTNVDETVLQMVDSHIRSIGVKIQRGKDGKDHYIIKDVESKNSWVPNPLVELITSLGMMGKYSHEKFIPPTYLFGSAEQRLDLLKGLMDTDGTIDKRGNCSFTTTSEVLANQVCDVARSLGMRSSVQRRYPSYTYKGIKLRGRDAFDVQIRSEVNIFNMVCKSTRFTQREKYNRRWKHRNPIAVELVRVDAAQCIMLDDADHLYITDDYVVTHNTKINAGLVDTYGKAGLKTLTIVPSTSLVLQTIEDFVLLGLDVGEYSGSTKDLEHTHVVSTWQALQKHPHLITQFQVVVVDEVHQAKSKILNDLVNVHGKNIPYRFGLTGTLPKDPAEAQTIKNAFGDVKYVVPAHELIEQDFLSSVDISIDVLYENHPEGYFPDYAAERSYLHTKHERIGWIANQIAARSQLPNGNSFCLVPSVSLGKKLQKLVPGSVFLHGADDAETRAKVYKLFETHDNLTVIATVQIAGTGLSINRIFNLFLIDIGKSFTRVIQAIGRGLRKGRGKDHVYVFDICSNLKYSKKHVAERIKFYKEAKYPHKKRVIKYRDYDTDAFDGSDDVLSKLESEISLDY